MARDTTKRWDVDRMRSTFYRTRKTDIRRGIKLPELKKSGVVTFGELALDAEAYAKAHLRTASDYSCKVKVLAEPFGSLPAAEITPNQIRDWLKAHIDRKKERWTPATANRYKAFMSTAYRIGMENSKITVNPARLVRSFKEDNARERFLSHKNSRSCYRSFGATIQNRLPASS